VNGPAGSSRPRIAVFSGATSTIESTEPLVTSNKARVRHGLPPLARPDGGASRFDALRPQRLAAPVTVYIEQYSAHPLERDAADLYAPPDGYLDAAGRFHRERQTPADVAVYEAVLHPDDGLYPLPYMARQRDGSPWSADSASASAPAERSRQPFYPDASRLFEEIDRFGIGDDGLGEHLSRKADFDFWRAAPSGGYRNGLPSAQRTDMGEGDIPAESIGEQFFPYRPPHLRREPSLAVLAHVTNIAQRAMRSGVYSGALWLEGSPFVEETAYWLNLVLDTVLPVAACAGQRAHGAVGNDGDRNLIDAVEYLCSGVWSDAAGHDSVGVVVIQDERIFTAREVQKADARPGGYIATGGHGGIVGTVGPAALTFRPVKRHTHASEVNVRRFGDVTVGSRSRDGRIESVRVDIKDTRGELVPGAIPKVVIVKHGRYLQDNGSEDPRTEVDLLARIERNLRDAPLAGFVAEGSAPFGSLGRPVEAALRLAVFSGMPVVKVGRGNADGFVPVRPGDVAIAGSNLTATKARLLLMAALLRFGALPPAADPARPTDAEVSAVRAKVAEYQTVFDTH
jgi:L-asparaginase